MTCNCVRWMVGPKTAESRVACLGTEGHHGPHYGLTTYPGRLEYVEWDRDEVAEQRNNDG